MNRVHNLICSSARWQRRVERELIPWGTAELELGERVLEVGPGLGATTQVLARRVRDLEVLELDEAYCRRLRRLLPGTVTVTHGDATALPYPDGSFSSVLCFTMLHHIPDRGLQDRAFAEFARVLRPGGVFAGTDSVGTGLLFKLIHVGDTLLPLDPDALPARLERVGFAAARVERSGGSMRFRADKP